MYVITKYVPLIIYAIAASISLIKIVKELNGRFETIIFDEMLKRGFILTR